MYIVCHLQRKILGKRIGNKDGKGKKRTRCKRKQLGSREKGTVPLIPKIEASGSKK